MPHRAARTRDMIVNPLVPATPPGDFIIIQPKPLKHRGEQPNPGTVLGVDEWEAVCKDRNAYSISILVEPDETTITSLTCRELLATSNCAGLVILPL